MKTINPFVLLTVLLWSSFSHAALDQSCVGKTKTVAPTERNVKDADGKDVESETWKNWKLAHTDWAVRQSWSCCPSLKLNAKTGVCEDPTLIDDSLVSCTTHGSCSQDKGCYPLREDDLFSTDSEDSAVIDAFKAKEDAYNEQMNSLGDVDPKEIGGSCYKDFECASYKCSGFKCVENKVCRLADKGEQAPGNIQCEEPFQKNNSSSTCNDTSVSYFPGALGKVSVQQVGGQQCQFELVPEGANLTAETVRQAANLGVATARSMEWLFATSPVEDRNDCLATNKWLKTSMSGLIDSRKEILKKFNTNYSALERDFTKSATAVQNDMTPVQSPCGDLTTAHDIALRRATGLDYMCYMQKRNEIFREYEQSMKAHVEKIYSTTSKKYQTAWGWGQNDKQWTIGDWYKTSGDIDCRTWPKWHKKIKRRWSQKYVVRGKSEDNAMALNSPIVQSYLGFVNHSDPQTGTAHFKKRKYYLIDPIVDFQSFGIGDRFERQLGFGKKASPLSLSGIRDSIRVKIIAHLRSLKKDQTADADFIYEPEIPSSFDNRLCLQNLDKPECARVKAIREAGGCIMNLDNPACSKLKDYVDTLQDVSFAQFLAYSHHTKRKYKDFFSTNETLRRRLFERVDTDLVNLSNYYTALDELRTKQNTCLDKVITQLKSPSFNSEGGITPGIAGAGNYYNQKNGSAGSKEPTVSNAAAGNSVVVANGPQVSLKVGTTTVNDNVMGKKIEEVKSISGSAGVDTSSSSALAAKMKSMQEANIKALNGGLNLNVKTKEFTDSLASGRILAGSSGMAGSSSASNDSAASNAGSSGNKATLDDDLDKDKSKDSSLQTASISGLPHSGMSGALDSSGANMNLGSGSATSTAGVGAYSGSTTEVDANAVDEKGSAAGMSEADQEHMRANYERSKNQYQPKDEDSLFQVLSKTYVRNLDRILIRKKKLGPDAASYPSSPSTP